MRIKRKRVYNFAYLKNIIFLKLSLYFPMCFLYFFNIYLGACGSHIWAALDNTILNLFLCFLNVYNIIIDKQLLSINLQ